MKPLQTAIDHFGSKAALARALGVEPMTVRQWQVRNRVPIERAIEIERVTQGAVTREDLRPDVFTKAA